MITSAPPSPTTSRSSRRRSRRGLVALLAAGVLLPGLLAACSSDAPEAGTSSGTASSSEAAAVGQCVRDAGYDVEDSDFIEKGLLMLPGDVEPGSDAADDYFDVVSGCQDSVGSGSLKLSDEEKDSFTQEMIEMAQCLRDEGFENVEDPVDGVWYGPEEYDGDPEYEAAIDKCQAGMQVAGR